ncbi:hypothetical protein HanRHA438_Chr14g0641081 [Helianthus annuus]|uniref:Uncharacterized protein n=1 Tax=Helianthus annuus TaxID=4232 RepID=A0A9K3E6H1_HELAN|nr:hypothetical protein HanXRQr2_Chr14g0630141 [Helianthus annuus]KAJ0463340.1 hypothetical protein HanHA300_Chr14g0514511 [Helianthus annuus]KAJ0484724.1 hypothetical protein HanHA89_Chr14g0560051 [Helianthus annuus]KAJ0655281.1 hypothetical protein HanLR1_Chr14g0522401 [Helianthus annuus]KAJ0658976.1 hypothetical protein HanOQP8_Chr14g0520751 [Helianthus annuus]
MNTLKDKREGFIYEKEVRERDFGPLNVINKFKALGWEAARQCYDRDDKNLFVDEIQEWMATLRCPPYNKPSQMKLFGIVNDIEVEMSFDTLRRVARFDSKPANKYMFPSLDDLYFKPEDHPRWNSMLEALFLPRTTHGTLYRKKMKIEAKLLLVICLHNVIPRRGDKVEVRYPEVPILYTLLHGAPLFPYRNSVLNNVWISGNSVGRKIIPHYRLITALLKMYGAIGSDDRGAVKRHKPFDLKRLGVGWKYQESERYHKLKSEGQRWRALKADARYHKLKSEGQRWRALKADARPLRPGEADEPDSGEEP